ncbi:hypothetical protein I5Q82_06350 [Acutalibacter muris]|uniref:DUF4364 domain-containing protein n=1 Tax=Acutalibacter muris TaxID=1796620 RepID=A0A1Z2XU93_9FIRM|nr:hypothetical protein [Acutalibacter muris]ANU54751.1 hypothetical protein A4V00_12395 [Hungateiclostridiaceae bacterium KB18]ASB42018.1 hypothetical protein ADH66_15975 [Acutalibacter muris]QQR31286.1 hypothetical protein I5Q82_06350 [Acutalibacter muris]
MKMDGRLMMSLYYIMDNLSRGIDPITNLQISNDMMLTSKVLQGAFAEAANVFKVMSDSIGEDDEIYFVFNSKGRKVPFFFLRQELELIPIVRDEVTISRFTFGVNELIHREGMRKLRATQLTSWLVDHNYLEEIESHSETVYKVSTELGESIGIHAIYKKNAAGEKYVTNTYSIEAQKFLVNIVLPQITRIVDIEPPQLQ